MPDETEGQEPTPRGQELPPSGPEPPPPAAGAPPAPAPEPAPEPEAIDPAYIRKLRAEAAEYRRRVRELEQTVRQHEEAKLSEQERLQRRLAELEREQATWQRERQERTLRYEVLLAAGRLGIIDPEAAYRLLDLTQLDYDEEGIPRNVEEALRGLIRAKPYLVATPAVGPTNPATGAPARGVFTTSQIADRRFYEAHRDEIARAVAEGRVVPG